MVLKLQNRMNSIKRNSIYNPGRFGFAAYSPKFCPYAAKFVLVLHLRRAFPTEPDFDRKFWILQTSLESRRDGIFVEKRDLANLSPVGAASTETCQKCREKSLN